MFRRSGVVDVVEGREDKYSVTRIDPQKCRWYVQPDSLRPELASETS